MEVHRQTCQQCGSIEMRNIVMRQAGKSALVLVRCGSCEQLVARYELKGYYHHGKGFEAWLRNVAVSTESSLDLKDAFANLGQSAEQELESAVAELAAKGKKL